MKRFNREDGFAMITAILVSVVVLALSLVVVNLAVHSSGESRVDRDRVLAINAAEAGLDNYMSALVTSPNPPCTSSVDVGSTPVEHFDVSILLYSSWPPSGSGQCPLPAGLDPAGALVTSKGTTLAGAPAISRSMETAIRLTPIYGGLNQAIFSDNQLNLQNKLDVNGNVGNDGDVYTNGDFAMQNNTVISGSVYAQGHAYINQGIVKADVWANNYVDLHNISVLGKVTSSISYIGLDTAHVYGDAKAGTAINLSNNSQVDGAMTPNSLSGPPPQVAFPQVTYVKCAWDGTCPPDPVGGTYTIVNYADCTLAKSFISIPHAGNYAVRISPTCALSWSNSKLSIAGNLAIITDGSFTLSQQNTWTGVGDKRTLLIIRPYEAGLPCSPSPSPYDINVSNNTSFNNLQTFVYTQCTINFGNNNASGFDGQIIGGKVNITNQMVVNFKPITVPGFNRLGYRSDVSYLREIPNS
jgi:type II secretory pathway pseudopilin PulG